MNPRPYADSVVAYSQAGWPCILPVPPETKTPPPVGFTGAEGRDTDPLTLVELTTKLPDYSVALRMPEGVIGIDVDAYIKGSVTKHGDLTLAHFVEKWGPLPATWTSTARGEGPSRIHLFRVPARRYVTKLDTGTTSDIEIIQRHHRYAVVWPSVHPGAGPGAIYRWYDPHGVASEAPPKPDELAELPEAWVVGLSEGATEAGPVAADRHSGELLLDQLLTDTRPECADITSARQTALAEITQADSGSRHDTLTARAHQLVQLASAGHPGFGLAVLELREAWAEVTAGEDREDEFERMLLTSARKAVTARGHHQVTRDPCLLMEGFPVPPSAPPELGGEDPELQIVEPPRWNSFREVLGAQSFDPPAGLDQTLAEAVLQRTYSGLRYAYDVNGWLLRCPDRWELHRRLSPWAVAQVATLMPHGDANAAKDDEQHARAQRRKRLMSRAGAGAVAGKMDDLVAGGMHPAAVALAGLDADAEILWAGGHPWSLRDSLEEPVVADVDPAAPHLHTAGVTPRKISTPLWDAFVGAVWPDPELRAWSMRVLSIAVTGHADRALPILMGETGRGKTQVVKLLMSVLGTYAHAANPKLLNPSANEHDTIIFDLKSRRLSFIDEAPRDAKAGQERLKQLTGGGELTGRPMNLDPVTFAPTHTLVLTANDEPVLTDPAVRARVRLLPCNGDPEAVRSARAAIGHVSSDAWRREAPGVLASLMAEAAAWLADPKTASVESAPAGVRFLAEELGAEQDPVAVWVTEETEPDESGTPSRELYRAFVTSCRLSSMRFDAIPSETKWGRALTRLGYSSVHTASGKRRPLVVRRHGAFEPQLPVDKPVTHTSQDPSSPDAPDAAGPPREAEPDGLNSPSDGLLTSSAANPSATKPQVSPQEWPQHDGLTGSSPIRPSHTTTHPHPQNTSDHREPPNPSSGAGDRRPLHKPQLPQRPQAKGDFA